VYLNFWEIRRLKMPDLILNGSLKLAFHYKEPKKISAFK
jgi:hypothetical protein